jgi:hypothetical protein
MEELYVKPHLWFETEIDGRLYKCKIKGYGYNYATIEIKKMVAVKRKKKHFFFGPMIDDPIFETITSSHRDDGIDPVMVYKYSYKATFIKKIVAQIVEQRPNTHSYRI